MKLTDVGETGLTAGIVVVDVVVVAVGAVAVTVVIVTVVVVVGIVEVRISTEGRASAPWARAGVGHRGVRGVPG